MSQKRDVGYPEFWLKTKVDIEKTRVKGTGARVQATGNRQQAIGNRCRGSGARAQERGPSPMSQKRDVGHPKFWLKKKVDIEKTRFKGTGARVQATGNRSAKVIFIPHLSPKAKGAACGCALIQNPNFLSFAEKLYFKGLKHPSAAKAALISTAYGTAEAVPLQSIGVFSNLNFVYSFSLSSWVEIKCICKLLNPSGLQEKDLTSFGVNP